MRAREQQRAVQRDKLDGVVEGHRQMADAHASSLDELRAQALSHRQAAVDHTRKAEELEQRIEREERHATSTSSAPSRPLASANRSNSRPMTLSGLAYVIIGAFVAAANHYFAHVGKLAGVFEAIIAILIWPLVLLGVDIRIR